MISICYFCIPLHGMSHLPSSALLSGVPCCLCPLTERPENCQKHQPHSNHSQDCLCPISSAHTQRGKRCLSLPQLPALQQDLKSHFPPPFNKAVALSHPLQSCSALTHTSLPQAAPAFLRGACCEPSQVTPRTREGLALLRGRFQLSPHRQGGTCCQ